VLLPDAPPDTPVKMPVDEKVMVEAIALAGMKATTARITKSLFICSPRFRRARQFVCRRASNWLPPPVQWRADLDKVRRMRHPLNSKLDTTAGVRDADGSEAARYRIGEGYGLLVVSARYLKSCLAGAFC
jgi:hypothetical protein